MLRTGLHFARLCPHGRSATRSITITIRPARTGCNVRNTSISLRKRSFHQIASFHSYYDKNKSCPREKKIFHYFSTCPADSSNNITHHTAHDDDSESSSATRVLLPTIGQNGTLILRSSNRSIAQVQIIPQWREDALLELLPLSNNTAITPAISSADRPTDWKDESNFDTFHRDESSSSVVKFGSLLQLTNHANGITTSLGRKGALIEVDVLNSHDDTQQNGINTISDDDEPSMMMKLVATVPEKSNLTIDIVSGDICITGKLEGDARLSTSHGDITVSKLRGHSVMLDTSTAQATTTGATAAASNHMHSPANYTSLGVIHVQKAIEAKRVQIKTASRVRARMLNGSQVSVQIMPPEGTPPSMTQRDDGDDEFASGERTFDKLDDDDGGALIDIGSLYISNGGGDDASDNEAQLITESNTVCHSGGLVRVKSSHGHVTVHAKTNTTHNINHSLMVGAKDMQPLVDLGGVNGSCDVTLEASTQANSIANASAIPSSPAEDQSNYVSTRVHFDSMAPESISTIATSSHSSCGQGVGSTASITVDRKLEADVRLMSVSKSGMDLPLHMVDAHSLTSDEVDEVRSALMEVDAVLQSNVKDDGLNKASNNGSAASRDGEKEQHSISIKTDAYQGKWGLNALSNSTASSNAVHTTQQLSPAIEYTQGVIKNRSGEPDSRFDVRSRGKINIDGAASQALHGFRGKVSEEEAASPSSPLLVVTAVNGKIELETLSWFGSIARRYGMEEESRGVGRQASRKPRLDE